MKSAANLRQVILAALVVGAWAAAPVRPQQPARPLPQPRAVAETRLLMQAINLPNFRGLEGLLHDRPSDTDAWTFARGQALLIAENGNLLMLRPPRTQGREAWLDRAADLRETATRLARAAAGRDYDRSRAGLVEVAASCNRCHETFRVALRLEPFPASPAPPKPSPRPSSPPVP